MRDTSSGFDPERTRSVDQPHALEALPTDPDDPNGQYTFVPGDADGDEHLTRWITVDREALVDLSSWR